MKNSYDQIKSLTASQKNRPRLQQKQNQDLSHNQAYTNKRTKENPNYTNYPNKFQRRPQAIPHGNLYNWDGPSNSNTNPPPPLAKNKQVESSNASHEDLIKRITQLETIIKDLSSEIGGLNIKQKQHTKDITLLQEQERHHEKDMALLNQHLTTINNNMIEQKETISSIPRIVTMLENMEQSGIFAQLAHNNDNAYDSAEEQQQQYYNEEYDGSNSGYESSGTVETHNIFPDPNYTPSKPTGENDHLISPNTQHTQPTFHNYLDVSFDYKQIVFATHNIQGGFQSKKDKIIELMVTHKIDFLHICETNERDNNFDITKSKAHIKYPVPFNNDFCKFFFIINNPDENKMGSGSRLIISEQLHNQLESTVILT
ncbi:hypothetical protein RhiirA4_515966 [Rhizophagus irregularis]|uniref:Endonuclease/exonuclease/phosphatase domain-containing protein n=1 Tax=Rhizophagus irregularis TaxID=588596 RepID=A0A2I1HL93_9GLOM|nr:hypothetical protein RhiirA4_515966 [Rhizophagus irregularis]